MHENEATPIPKQEFNAREIFEKVKEATETNPANGREDYVKTAAMAAKTCDVLEMRKFELEQELDYITKQFDKFSDVVNLMLKTIENESKN